MEDFKNKNIIVVGGSSGIGLELSLNLRKKGAEVYVWSRNSRPDFETKGIHFSSIDVSKPLSQNLPAVPSVLHGLVYCPGNIRLVPFLRLKDEDFLEDFRLNVLGAIRCIRVCLSSLTDADGSSTVLISTVAARIGMSYHTSVATVKSALEGLAKSLAAEYAGKNLRVNVVAPSLTNTRLSVSLLNSEEKRGRSAQRHPLKRYGEPSDIANTIEFLLSDNSSWITGQVFSIDGGMSSIKLFSS